MNDITDISILEGLCSDGLDYLENMYITLDTTPNEHILQILNNYNEMYLEETDIFENNIKLYMNNIIRNDGYLWNKVCEKMDKDNIDNHIQLFIQESVNLSLKDRVILFKNVYNPKVLDIIENQEYWTSSIFGSVHFIDLFLQHKNYSNDTILENYINDIFQLVSILLKRSILRNKFISMIVNILNNHIGRGNIQLVDLHNDFLSENILINIFLLLHKIFYYKYNNSRTELIDTTYIISTSCEIRWANKKLDNSKYNFVTKLFFTLLQALRVCYIPNISLLKDHEGEIKYLESIVNEVGGIIALRFNQNTIQNNIQKIKNNIKSLKVIMNNTCINKCINDIVNVISYMMVESNKIQLNINNDIIDIIATYIQYKQKSGYLINNKNLIKLIIRIISTTIYINNPHTRILYVKIIKYSIDNKLLDITQGTVRKRLFEGLMTSYIHLDKLPEKNIYKMNILLLMQNLGKNVIKEDVSNTLYNILDKNEDKLKKFILTIITDYSEILDIFLEDLGHLKTNPNRYTRRTLLNIFELAKIYLKLLNIKINFLTCLTTMVDSNQIQNILLSPELKNNFVSLITRTIKDTNFNNKYSIFVSRYNITFSMVDIITDIFKMCNSFDEKVISKELVDNGYFNKTLFDSIQLNNNIMNRFDTPPLFLSFLDDAEKEIIDYNTIEDFEIPYEFCDPLLCTPIETPIVLPETRTIVDKKCIYTQLLQKEEHPFTRSILTKTMLNEYNQQPEAIEIIEEFKERFRNWVSKNKST